MVYLTWLGKLEVYKILVHSMHYETLIQVTKPDLMPSKHQRAVPNSGN